MIPKVWEKPTEIWKDRNRVRETMGDGVRGWEGGGGGEKHLFWSVWTKHWVLWWRRLQAINRGGAELAFVAGTRVSHVSFNPRRIGLNRTPDAICRKCRGQITVQQLVNWFRQSPLICILKDIQIRVSLAAKRLRLDVHSRSYLTWLWCFVTEKTHHTREGN